MGSPLTPVSEDQRFMAKKKLIAVISHLPSSLKRRLVGAPIVAAPRLGLHLEDWCSVPVQRAAPRAPGKLAELLMLAGRPSELKPLLRYLLF